ncbi:hypothetical protein AWB67_05898 [Caballeronia terrestris]|uniref:Uncharacterized protein n=1 Tax=Caballeronia terrestris TaxID=1226301 RepID=A0A158KKE5_9BURK|nr:hypothetical protein AWB67_05898 [Caballeronia terrestris]
MNLPQAIRPLRQRMIDDMRMRKLTRNPIRLTDRPL